MIEWVLIITILLGGIAAIGWLYERIRDYLSQRQLENPYSTKSTSVAVYFSNGWHGFKVDSEDDILFHL